jgi:UDP-2,3-diacylglucosamine hydrolase
MEAEWAAMDFLDQSNTADIRSGTLAIIAGGGRLPRLVLDGARAMGLRVVGVGFAGETEADLAQSMDAWQWLHLGSWAS